MLTEDEIGMQMERVQSVGYCLVFYSRHSIFVSTLSCYVSVKILIRVHFHGLQYLC